MPRRVASPTFHAEPAVERAMPKQTKGKRNAHARALLFPIPIGIQEILAHLSIADQTKVYQYLNRIRRAVLGLSVGPVPLRSERAPLYDCMAKILEATPGMPLNTAARQAIEQCGQFGVAHTASLARWLVDERKKLQPDG